MEPNIWESIKWESIKWESNLNEQPLWTVWIDNRKDLHRRHS